MKLFKFSSLFLVALLISCASGPSKTGQSGIDTPAFLYYQHALTSLEQGNYQRALAQMDTAISLRKEFAQFHYVRGQILELLGRRSDAIKAYEVSLNYKSHFPEAWRNLATLYLQSAQYEKAVQVLKELTEDLPDSLRFELLLAEAYVRNEQPLLALDFVRSYEKQGGKSPETFLIRGLAYFQQEDFPRAMNQLDNFVQKKPQNFEAQKYLGIACIKSGALEKGISHLNDALKINPDDPIIYLYRARYFLQRQKYATAADQLNAALNLDANNSEILLEISKFALMKKDTVRAQTALEMALNADDECWECYKLLGIIADDQGHHFEALLYLQKYLSNIYTKDPDAEERLNRLRQINQ
jgi:tetratricopeptide (TPR) repeat protein